MPNDMQDAFRKAGMKGAAGDRCPKCGRPKDPNFTLCRNCSRPDRPAFDFPNNYPNYFDEGGVTRAEYVTNYADDIARRLGDERLSMHQLRAFYQYAKRQEAALEHGRSFREVLFEIRKLKPFAFEREQKKKIPPVFRRFIDLNIDKVTDEKTFLRGFIEHFQAVVAYCAGRLSDREA